MIYHKWQITSDLDVSQVSYHKWCVWHDSFMCVTWLICKWAITSDVSQVIDLGGQLMDVEIERIECQVLRDLQHWICELEDWIW